VAAKKQGGGTRARGAAQALHQVDLDTPLLWRPQSSGVGGQRVHPGRRGLRTGDV